MIDYTKKIKVVYLKVKEELIDFLNRCKIKGSEIMLCPCCNIVFNKEAKKSLENIKPRQPRKSVRDNKRP